MTATPPAATRHRVFVTGEEGNASFRIPSRVVPGNGDPLAIAEGRRDPRGDHGGAIPVVAKTSTYGGPPCGPLATVARSGMPNPWIALPDEPGGENRIDLAVCSRRG